MKYKLLTPFVETVAKEKVFELTIREVQTVGDVLAAKREGKSGEEAVYALLARMCGLTLKDVELMDMRDAEAVLALMDKLYAPPAPEGAEPPKA